MAPAKPAPLLAAAGAATLAMGALALKKYLAARRVRASDAAAMAILGERNGRMHSPESVAAGRSFATRPSDVFIVTYPKCGTTWVASPRLFKSHESYETVAKGGRYIYVARDPKDAFWSFYKFLPAYMQCGPLSVECFARGIFGGLSHSGGIWTHFAGWWPRRRDGDVLWVCYEDVKRDPAREIRRVAAFMGVDADDATVERVRAATTLAAMSADGSKYDDHFVFGKLRAQMGFPDDAVHMATKVRSGQVGGSKALPPKVARMLEDRWRGTMQRRTGLGTYAELRASVAH
ncbi:sulfotransferase [Aureococcus anophagefferens]|nr:sulfotransferase [Aureococcus anophagefferens]